LLQAILAGHPGLFAPPELHLLWFHDLAERRAALNHAGNRHLTSGAIRALMALEELSPEAAIEKIGDYESQHLLVSDFYRLLQQKLGGRLLVDKTPANAYSMRVLQRAEELFEDPIYIHLVRHPGGMTRSFVDAKLERTAPFMQRHMNEFSTEQFAELAWLTCNRQIVEFLDGIPRERSTSIYYEDVVTAPEATIADTCRFFGLPFELTMLDLYTRREERMVDGLHRVGEFSGDLKFHLHNRIDPDAAYRWKRFDAGDRLSEQSWELAERLGYQRGG
jgi:hypothetical protein